VQKELELWRFTADKLMKGQHAMLLVVATSSGSSPGRPGYKMAVAEDGDLVGSIGGGVMEVNLVEQSRRTLRAQGAASPASGEVRANIREQVHRKNVPDSSGMICSGKQTVIFKLLTPVEIEMIHQAAMGVEKREGHTLLITPGSIEVKPPEVETVVSDLVFDRRSDTNFEYRERLGAKNDLIIIGGGHCSLALSELMSKMDFYIRLFDDRPQLNTIEKNEFANDVNVIDTYEDIGLHIESSDSTYVVVMTLGYKSDQTVIRQLIGKDFKYFGVLGSEAKMATLFRELTDAGAPKEWLDLIHTPIGLPINSHSPEEIAISIAAEIIAAKNNARL